MVIILTWVKELLTFLLFFLAISLMLSMSHLLQAVGLASLDPQILLMVPHLTAVLG